MPGIGSVTYTGVTYYLADGRAVFTPTDGQVLQSGTLQSASFVTSQGSVDLVDFEETVPCFTRGTCIATPRGDVPAERLRVGDPVLTLDHGPQPVSAWWHGAKSTGGRGSHPCGFAPGVLGKPPARSLVSPQHRVLVQGWRAELLFGEPEVLVAALHMVDGDRVTRAPVDAVDYIHLAFDRHEIVYSEGALTESFNPGAALLKRDRALRSELAALFPEAVSSVAGQLHPAARPGMRGTEARALAGLSA